MLRPYRETVIHQHKLDAVLVLRPNKFEGFAGVGAKQRQPLLRPYWEVATHQNCSDGVLDLASPA
jgi:hypothetical protein